MQKQILNNQRTVSVGSLVKIQIPSKMLFTRNKKKKNQLRDFSLVSSLMASSLLCISIYGGGWGYLAEVRLGQGKGWGGSGPMGSGSRTPTVCTTLADGQLLLLSIDQFFSC